MKSVAIWLIPLDRITRSGEKKRTALFQIVYIQTGDIFGCTQKPSAPLLATLNSIYILYICHMLYFL